MSAAVEIVRSAIDVMREEIRKEICEEIRAQRDASNLRRKEEALRRKEIREVEKEEKRREKELKAQIRKEERELEAQIKQAMKEERWREKAQVKAQVKEMKALAKRAMEEEKWRERMAKEMMKDEEKLKMLAYVRCECSCVLRTTSMKQHLKGDKHACLLQAMQYESDDEM